MWYQIGLLIAVFAGAMASANAAVSTTQPAFYGQTSEFDFVVSTFHSERNTGNLDVFADLDVGSDCALWSSGCTFRHSVTQNLPDKKAPEEVRASLSRPMSLGLAALWFSATLLLMASLASRLRWLR